MTAFYLGAFGCSLLLGFVLTKYVRDGALAKGWVTRPSTDRHVHTQALPRLGGVAITFAFLLTILLGVLLAPRYPQLRDKLPLPFLKTVLIPAGLIFLLGLYDDLRGARPWLKFSVQGIAGSMLFWGGLRILEVPVLFGARRFGWFAGLLLTVFWVIGITNAFNLIDGLDGLAAGSALFSTMVVFVVALVNHNEVLGVITIALAGAILGFLRFNFNPATIFLGDCGSLFIGFLLSALALGSATKSPTVVAVAIPVVSFGLPILETGLSVLRRFINGRPVFTADREHIHHKLLQRGLSHRQVVIVLYAVSGLFALLSLFLLWPTGSTLGLVLAVLGTGIWVGVQHLGYLEFGELRRVAQRTIEQRQIFVNNLAIRRALEELRSAQDVQQIHTILLAAFEANDFDEFEWELDSGMLLGAEVQIPSETLGRTKFRWIRTGGPASTPTSSWRLTLDLVTSTERYLGTMTLARVYSSRALQLDVNLLTIDFPHALADALERTLYVPLKGIEALEARAQWAAARAN